MLIAGGDVWSLKVRGWGNSCGRPLPCDSTPTGDMPPWKPKPGDLACDGEETCELGVAWNCGDGTPYAPSRCDMPNASDLEAMLAGCLCPGRGPAGPGADLGGPGLALAEEPGAPVFSRSSACTSMPVESRVSHGRRGGGMVMGNTNLSPAGCAPARSSYSAASSTHQQRCDGSAAGFAATPHCA